MTKNYYNYELNTNNGNAYYYSKKSYCKPSNRTLTYFKSLGINQILGEDKNGEFCYSI